MVVHDDVADGAPVVFVLGEGEHRWNRVAVRAFVAGVKVVLGQLAHGRDEQSVLAAEIVVNLAMVDASPSRDVTHGDRTGPDLAEHSRGGGDQRVAYSVAASMHVFCGGRHHVRLLGSRAGRFFRRARISKSTLDN